MYQADIDVKNTTLDMDSRVVYCCYPWRNLIRYSKWHNRPPLSSLKSTLIPVRFVNLTVKYLYGFARFTWFMYKLKISLRTSVTLWEVSAPDKLPNNPCSTHFFVCVVRIEQFIWMVFHWSILQKELGPFCYTFKFSLQGQFIVKLYRVFSCMSATFESSRTIIFRWVPSWDSVPVVTLFMQVYN